MQSASLQSFPPLSASLHAKYHLKNEFYAAKSKQKLAPCIFITLWQIAKQTHKTIQQGYVSKAISKVTRTVC